MSPEIQIEISGDIRYSVRFGYSEDFSKSGNIEVAAGWILFYRHSMAYRSTVSVYHDYVDSLTEPVGIDG